MGYHWGILFVSDLGINFRLLCMYVQLNKLLINILSCVEEGNFSVIWGSPKSIRQSFPSPEIGSPCLSGFGPQPLIAAVCYVLYSKSSRFECITYSWLWILERNNARTEYYSCRQMTQKCCIRAQIVHTSYKQPPHSSSPFYQISQQFLECFSKQSFKKPQHIPNF